MRIVVIGGTGHIGTYLIPRLVSAGHDVVSVSRQRRRPYQPNPAWAEVEQVSFDRQAAEAAGQFGNQIKILKPDAVIDLICFNVASARQLVTALRGSVSHFLHCGTIWVHGASQVVPTTENHPRKPFGEYGIQKAAVETYLLEEARQNGFPATIHHPGHMVGPGWSPVNPEGHTSHSTFQRLAKGDTVYLPNLGLETVHHVHADDVAGSFVASLENRSSAVGENFHIVAAQALTLRGFAEAMAAWYGKPANIKYLPWEAWKTHFSEREANVTLDHISHSPNCAISKAQRLIGYQPRYTSLQAVQESVSWMDANQQRV